jgi:DNA topoisomerase-1
LKRASDGAPGYTRRTAGGRFVYYRASGSRLRDAAELSRIRMLAIPPAWTSVWICADSQGHIQATGRDARGRKQYRYHAHWTRARARRKYDRMLDFARRLPRIRRRIRRHLAQKGLRRERVLAALIRLLELTSIRVGNSEYARSNRSYGLTTLRRKHIATKGDVVTFRFNGKGSKPHVIEVADRRLAAIIVDCLAVPGTEVFKFIDKAGKLCDVTAAHVNDYLRQLAGDDFTAKDFRTWTATVLVVQQLLQAAPARTQRQRKAQLLSAIDRAADRLGNTRAICRKSYVHPAIETRYLTTGTLGAQRMTSYACGSPRGDKAALNVLRKLPKR